jgi:hypothetical protein
MPQQSFPLAAAGAGARIGFVPHAIFGVMQDAAYLAILGAVLVPVTLYSHLRPLILRRGGKCVRTVLAMTEMLLLFVGFALCTVYFMPQFPRLAEVGAYRM